MYYKMLCVYYFVYFVMNGVSIFLPKYFSEIGMTNGQIGILTSLPTVFAMAIMPLLGILTDRVSKKRYLLTLFLIIMAVMYFLTPYSDGFLMLLAVVSVSSIIGTAAHPLHNTIALEYATSIGRSYGPIRMMGTAGYQAGTLLVGIVLSKSLENLYPMMGAFALLACGLTFGLPNVEGHQHSKKKVPITKLFADKHVSMLYIMIFFSKITTQFYMSFYTKHLGDLGMSNTVVSVISLLSVMAEIPFLFFGDKLAKRTNVWNWILIGMVANGVRWIGLAFSKTAVLNILFQIPAVSVMACFEFFPALYLNRRVPAELTGSAQNMLSLVSFCAAKIIGGLIGGQISEYTGIPAIFAFNGIMILVCFLVFWGPSRKLIKTDTVNMA